MNNFLCLSLVMILIVIGGCSAKKDPELLSVPTRGLGLIVETPDGDIDGDLISNKKERELGRNPFVAELPELEIRFLQNYKISFIATGKENTLDSGQIKNLEINTLTGRDDPDFRYKVGNLFARHNTYKVLANIGRFAGHTWGDIDEHDFSWVKYPNIDPVFYHRMMLDSRPYVRNPNFDIGNISIGLENNIRLKPNSHFKEITDVEVSFYYYDYQSESYELLKTELIKRHFKAGITETFQINIENAPLELLTDNYLSKGEFIISEITNYQIPELKMDYKTYIRRIREKSIPVVVNTPRETSKYYVGVNGKLDSFIGIMEHLFPKKVKILENKLTKVEQFENNLRSYTYLREIRDQDKNGQWFVLTNKLSQHYLDHGYTPRDRIIISYVTGKELATQKDELIYSFKNEVSGGDDYILYPIGNIAPNSKIDIQIRPLKRYGQSSEYITEIFDIPQHSCGRNCVNFGIYCKWEVNIVKDYDEAFLFNKEFTADTSLIELVINDSIFALSDLVKEEKIRVKWPSNGNLHVIIDDIQKIKELNNFDTNLVQLKIKTTSKFDFWGAKLVAVDRSWHHRHTGCGATTPLVSKKFGTKYISKESIHFNHIYQSIHEDMRPEFRDDFILKEEANMYQRIKVHISSTINNFYN